MSSRSRLPRPAVRAAPASLPPDGLPGMDARHSRLVDVAESGTGSGSSRRWHLIDNAPALRELGVTPVGTLLCVHGNPTWSYLWRDLVSQATAAAGSGGEAWRVIAVDQLEMGFSCRTGSVRPLARRVADLHDLSTALELDGPVVTVGHDWGGVVSLGWAVDHPELLAGVVLLNTAVHQPEGRSIPWPLRLALSRGVLGGVTVTTPAFLDTTLALAHPPLPPEVRAAYRAPYRSAGRRGGIGAFVSDIPVDARHESSAELARIAEGVRGLGVPALMLWGPRDPIFSDTYLDDLAERLPHADIHRFEGAGHLVAEDVDYAGATLTWLADRRAEIVPDGPVPAPPGPLASAPPLSRPAVESPRVRAARPPLWSVLDQLRDSSDTALVDMAPPGSATPRAVSWRLLSTRVRQLAAGLSSVGVVRGDRVSLLVPPGADLTAVLYACLRIGAVVVVADAGLGLAGLTRAVRGARPDYVIGALPGLAVARAFSWPGRKISTSALPSAVASALGVRHSLADLVRRGRDEQLPEPPEPKETAAVLFTSGSTGPAKGVVYTHEQLSALRDALAAQYEVGIGTGLVAGFAPFALLGPALGARSVTPDMAVTSPRTLTASAVASAVAAVDATVLFLSPAALANVVATADALTAPDKAALAGVRTVLSAGAPVPEQLLAASARLMPGAVAHTPYGMTEGLLMTDITLEGIRDGSRDPGPGGVCVGAPTETARVRISALDARGHATGSLSDDPGATGEIVLSAPHLKDRYDRLWLTNRVAGADSTTTERWHRTGDVGHLDSAGRVWVEGRLPHVIVTAGGVVTPVGPEQRIESIRGVRRAALVGIGPRGTQQLVAVIETDGGPARVRLADAGLAASVRHAVGAASGGSVAAVLVVPRLPTDIRHNSKIDRSALSGWAERILAGGRLVRP